MKLRMCAFLLVVGCNPSDPFVNFSRPFPDDSDAAAFDAGAIVEEDGGGSDGSDSGSDAGRELGKDGSVEGGSGGAAVVAAGGRSGRSTGGVASGGASTGGKPPVGGSPGSGGVIGAGGEVDACVLTTHTNGLSSTWRDCVPLGTYDKAQAMRACEASGAQECRPSNCGVGNLVVCGYKQAYVYGCWGYEGEFTGYVKERSDSCSAFGLSWG